jgi:hypothetical protein
MQLTLTLHRPYFLNYKSQKLLYRKVSTKKQKTRINTYFCHSKMTIIKFPSQGATIPLIMLNSLFCKLLCSVGSIWTFSHIIKCSTTFKMTVCCINIESWRLFDLHKKFPFSSGFAFLGVSGKRQELFFQVGFSNLFSLMMVP